MPEVIADPAKLRQFAKTLAASAQQFDDLTRRLQRSLDATGWRGSDRQRFEQDFRQALKTISQFSERLRHQDVPNLQRRAEALERFQA